MPVDARTRAALRTAARRRLGGARRNPGQHGRQHVRRRRANIMCVGQEINANHVRAARRASSPARRGPCTWAARTQVWSIDIVNEAGKLVCISRLTVAVIRRGALGSRCVPRAALAFATPSGYRSRHETTHPPYHSQRLHGRRHALGCALAAAQAPTSAPPAAAAARRGRARPSQRAGQLSVRADLRGTDAQRRRQRRVTGLHHPRLQGRYPGQEDHAGRQQQMQEYVHTPMHAAATRNKTAAQGIPGAQRQEAGCDDHGLGPRVQDRQRRAIQGARDHPRR